jgi:dihydroxyacetone kinase-like protein
MKKSILLVSHSQKVTDGLKEMIEQMQQSKEVAIFSLGGVNEEIIEEGAKGIQARGKAQAEDKTMLDVWIPVTEALKKNHLTQETIEQAKEHTKN